MSNKAEDTCRESWTLFHEHFKHLYNFSFEHVFSPPQLRTHFYRVQIWRLRRSLQNADFVFQSHRFCASIFTVYYFFKSIIWFVQINNVLSVLHQSSGFPHSDKKKKALVFPIVMGNKGTIHICKLMLGEIQDFLETENNLYITFCFQEWPFAWID